MKKYIIFMFLNMVIFMFSCQPYTDNNEYILEKYTTISNDELYTGLYVEDYIYIIKKVDNVKTCLIYNRDTLEYIEEKPFLGLSFIKDNNYYYILDADEEFTTIKKTLNLFNEGLYSTIFNYNKYLGFNLSYDANNKFFIIGPTYFYLVGEVAYQYEMGSVCIKLEEKPILTPSSAYNGYLYKNSTMLSIHIEDDIYFVFKEKYLYESYIVSTYDSKRIIYSNDINKDKEYKIFQRVFYDSAYIWLLALDYDNNIDLLKIKVVNPF